MKKFIANSMPFLAQNWGWFLLVFSILAIITITLPSKTHGGNIELAACIIMTVSGLITLIAIASSLII